MIKNRYYLSKFARLLSSVLRTHKRFDLYQKEFDLDRIFETFNKKKKNDVIIYGDPGSGKESLLMSIALRIAKNQVPFNMTHFRLFEFDYTKLTTFLSKFEDPKKEFPHIMHRLLLEMSTIKNAIFYFVGFEALDSYPDDGFLSTFLKLKNFKKLLICTTNQYIQNVEHNNKYLKNFEWIQVSSFNLEESITFLKHIRPQYEFYHNVKISDENLKLIFNLSETHFNTIAFPLRAVNLIDHCLSVESLKIISLNKNVYIKSFLFSVLKNINQIKYNAFKANNKRAVEFLQELEFIYKSILLKLANNINLTDLIKYLKLAYNTNMFVFNKRILKLLYLILTKHIKNDSILLTQNIKEQKELKKKKINSNLNKIYKCLVYYSSQMFGGFDKELQKPYITGVSLINPNIENNLNDFYSEDILLSVEYFEFFKYYTENLYSKFYKKRLQNIYLSFRFKKLKKNIDKNNIFYYFTDKLKIFLNNSSLKAFVQTFDKKEITIKNILNTINLPINILKNAYKKSRFKYDFNLKFSTIYKTVSNFIGHEITKPKSINYSLLKNLDSILKKDVLGQSEAISAICNIIRRASLHIQDPNRPLGSLLFCGSTGVGKTEIVKILVKTLYGSEKELIRFDMSEFMEKHTVARLIGSPPGYVGYDEGGQLTDAVKRKPQSVILFDEIEKAFPEILTILLQVLDDGRLTDGKGNLIAFNDTIIIMTSNVGSAEILKHYEGSDNLVQEIIDTKNFGDLSQYDSLIDYEQLDNSNIFEDFNLAKDFNILEENFELINNLDFLNKNINSNIINLDNITKHLVSGFEKTKSISINKLPDFKLEKTYSDKPITKIKTIIDNVDSTEEFALSLRPILLKRFVPEFLNRIDKIIIFKPLQKESLRKICDISCLRYINRMKSAGVTLSIDESVKIFLTERSYDPEFGARPLRRNITTFIENIVSTELVNRSSSDSQKRNLNFHIYINSAGKIVIK